MYSLYIRITAIVKSREILLTNSTRIGRRHVFVIEEKNGLSAKNLMLTLFERCNVLLNPNRGFAIYPIVTSDPSIWFIRSLFLFLKCDLIIQV
jgi:hypothetical protein